MLHMMMSILTGMRTICGHVEDNGGIHVSAIMVAIMILTLSHQRCMCAEELVLDFAQPEMVKVAKTERSLRAPEPNTYTRNIELVKKSVKRYITKHLYVLLKVATNY